MSGDFPWSKLRQAQKLLGLSEKYGAEGRAGMRALSFSLIDVFRLKRIIKQTFTRRPKKEVKKEAEEQGGTKDPWESQTN